MYSKQEASLIRKKFWETAGQYFAPMPSAGAEKVNWINYKTGVRFIAFKMHVDEKVASIAIEISHPDSEKRTTFFDYFTRLKNQLGNDWQWEKDAANSTSQIYRTIQEVNIYKPETWPAIISFLKTGIVELDAFWVEYKDVFEMID